MLTLSQAAIEMKEATKTIEELLSNQELEGLSEPTLAVLHEMRDRIEEVNRALQAGDVEKVKLTVPEAEEAARCVEVALSADRGCEAEMKGKVSEVLGILSDFKGQLAL